METVNGGTGGVGPGPIEWGVAALTMRGESESGDRYVVTPFPDGVLVGAIDGLGHGGEAAAAAALAVRTLEEFAAEPLSRQVQHCHDRLLGTRGAVLSVSSLNAVDQTMTWLGVGNVKAILLPVRAHDAPSRPEVKRLIPSAGVVGYTLPVLRPESLALQPGDLLVFATDGVRIGFAADLHSLGSVSRIADRIVRDFGRQTDDALVLVVRYLGGDRT